MVKIQLEISEDEDYIIENYKAQNRLKDKKEAIKQIVCEFNKIKKIVKGKNRRVGGR